jgi:hypothetical protein
LETTKNTQTSDVPQVTGKRVSKNIFLRQTTLNENNEKLHRRLWLAPQKKSETN